METETTVPLTLRLKYEMWEYCHFCALKDGKLSVQEWIRDLISKSMKDNEQEMRTNNAVSEKAG